MANANDRLQDQIIKRAVDLLAFDSQLADRVIRALNSAEKELTRLLREDLDEIGVVGAGKKPTAGQVEQLGLTLREVKKIRKLTLATVRQFLSEDLRDLNVDEVEFIQAAFDDSLGIKEVQLDAPTRARVRAATFGTPYGQGPGSPTRQFGEWFSGLARGDSTRIEGAIQAGFLEGDTIEGIVRRVRGTPALGGADGVTEITRRSARTLVRTTVNRFSNAAREEVFAENSDVISALKWTSTLDGRTTPICQSRDGKLAPLPPAELVPENVAGPRLQPPNARPPAHPNCRSVMVAIVDPEGVSGKRPFVTDTRGRREREIDFRRQARESGKSIQQVRADWARDRVGRLPAETTYQQWLTRQKASFQDEVLGPTRGKLFRGGGLTLDRFVANSGRRLTLPELKALHPKAFEVAGV